MTAVFSRHRSPGRFSGSRVASQELQHSEWARWLRLRQRHIAHSSARMGTGLVEFFGRSRRMKPGVACENARQNRRSTRYHLQELKTACQEFPQNLLPARSLVLTEVGVENVSFDRRSCSFVLKRERSATILRSWGALKSRMRPFAQLIRTTRAKLLRSSVAVRAKKSCVSPRSVE